MNAREITEFQKKVWVPEEATFSGLTTLCVATKEGAEAVYNAFASRGYISNIVSGEFFKVFTMNPKEFAELEQVLVEIDQLGLTEVFKSNLRIACFKKTFLNRLKVFLNNNLPYLNQDNTFVSELFKVGFAERLQFCVDNGFVYKDGDQYRRELYNADEFAQYTVHKPVEMIKTAQELSTDSKERENLDGGKLEQLDAEDKQVYHQVIESLNFLILQNPTNEYLPVIVNNISNKIVEAILRKEYRFLPLGDVIDGVMFDGIDVTPEMEQVKDLILSAFPDELNQKEERGLA